MEYIIKLEGVFLEKFQKNLLQTDNNTKDAILPSLSNHSGKSVEELSKAWDNPVSIKFLCKDDVFEVVRS